MFAATRAYPVGGSSAVAVGDFNKDGNADVAVASSTGTNDVQIFLGNGDGTLQPPTNYTVSSYPQYIAVSDFNHDGNPDLIINALTQPWVLLGNGNGTFQPGIPNTGTAVYGFTFGTFNSDTNEDLAVNSDNGGNPSVGIRLGNGDGTFQTNQAYIIYPNEGVGGLAVGDMNGDAKSDIVAGTSGHIGVLLGNGDGTFHGPTNSVASTNTFLITLGDFNGDGTNDVASGNYDTGKITIFLGNNTGSLVSNALYNTGIHLQALTIADFNGDGTNDLAGANGGAVAILIGNGNGTFQTPVNHDGLWLSVATADFDGDGKTDLVSDVQAGSSRIGISFGNGDGTFQIAPHYAVLANPEFVAMGDLNGDGRSDLAVADTGANKVSVLLNNGNGTFQPATNFSTATAPESLAIADLNGDGTNDVVASTDAGTNQLSILIGNGNGTFRSPTNYGSFGGGPMAVADFNGDHKLDVLANSLLYGMQVQLGNGNGTFHSAASAADVNAFGFNPGSLAVGYFNNDTNLDFALAISGTNVVAIALGLGNGTFQPTVKYFAGTNCQSVTTGDFNGDGNSDLAVANLDPGANGTVSVLLGNGNGTFQSPVQYVVGVHPNFVLSADFNGDNKLDLAVRNLSGFGMFVLLGNGDGTFQPGIDFSTISAPTYSAMAVGDLNGDGKPDAALLNLAPSVSILLNTCTSVGPLLSISMTNSAFVFSWPVSASGVTLESTTNLTSPNWQTAAGSRVTNGGTVQMTVPLNQPGGFFRLHQP